MDCSNGLIDFIDEGAHGVYQMYNWLFHLSHIFAKISDVPSTFCPDDMLI
jgi:hypothetical protein